MEKSTIKTIVIVYDQAYMSGGAAKIAISAAVALKEEGFRVIYFSALEPVDETLTQAGVEVKCVGGQHIGKTKSPVALLQALWNKNAEKHLDELLQTLDKKTTVVHVHGWTKCLSASIFSACKKNHIKTFITLHEYFSICPNGGLFDYRDNSICDIKPCSVKCYLKNCDKRRYIQKLYRDIRQIVTNRSLRLSRPNVIYISEFSRKILEPNISFSNRSFLVENHVEIQDNEKIDVSQNEEYLFIGRMSKEKGPELFCEAITRAGVCGTVIGEGPELVKLKNKYSNITFTGWLSQQQMKPYIEKARCLIISSEWYETMGLTIIEMQAKGIPCIVPFQCAGSDYIENEENGILYQIEKVESLVDAIEKTKDHCYIKKMSENFYKDYNSVRFSMDRHINELIKVYNS